MGFESVKKIAEADFPTRWGAFRILGFEGVLAAPRPCAEATQAEENGPPASTRSRTAEVEGLVALVMGDIHSAPPLVRIHSQCLTGDVFGSLRCDCRCNWSWPCGRSPLPARAFCSMSSRRAAASA
jgi:GTP cyclohydrolase II